MGILTDTFDIALSPKREKSKGGKTMTKHKVHHRKHKEGSGAYSMHFDRGNLTMPKKAFGHETLSGAGMYFEKPKWNIHASLDTKKHHVKSILESAGV